MRSRDAHVTYEETPDDVEVERTEEHLNVDKLVGSGVASETVAEASESEDDESLNELSVTELEALAVQREEQLADARKNVERAVVLKRIRAANRGLKEAASAAKQQSDEAVAQQRAANEAAEETAAEDSLAMLTVSHKRRAKVSAASAQATTLAASIAAASVPTFNGSVTLDDVRKIKSLANAAESRLDDLAVFDERSSDSTDSSSDDDNRRKHGRRGSKYKRKKSGKLLHVSSRVAKTERWPQAYLARTQPGSGDRKYDDLSMQEFMAGEMVILSLSKISASERDARIKHLGQVMMLACFYQWDAVLSFHARCLISIERRELKWGDSFAQLESTSLCNRLLPVEVMRKPAGATPSVSGAVYCGQYNGGTCPHDDSHSGDYGGKHVTLLHVCAACLRKGKTMAKHPRGDAACPLKSN